MHLRNVLAAFAVFTVLLMSCQYQAPGDNGPPQDSSATVTQPALVDPEVNYPEPSPADTATVSDMPPPTTGSAVADAPTIHVEPSPGRWRS